MQIQKIAWVFAVVFLGVGVLGFVPMVTPGGMLLGIFQVDTLHNVIHLLSGAVAAYAAHHSAHLSRLYFKVFGVIYAVVAVLGLAMGGNVLGLIQANMADHILHVVLAVAILYMGFVFKETSNPAPMV